MQNLIIKRTFNFRINYIGTLKTVFTNRAFVIMFFVLGGNMSFISTLATKMEQIMCRSDNRQSAFFLMLAYHTIY